MGSTSCPPSCLGDHVRRISLDDAAELRETLRDCVNTNCEDFTITIGHSCTGHRFAIIMGHLNGQSALIDMGLPFSAK